MACEPFDAADLTEDAARRCAARLGFDLSLEGELEYLLAVDSVDVQAAPGSGKTSLTGVKLCMLSSVWTSKRQGICVLSHTNTAKDQIRSILERDDAGRALLSYPHFVGTIQTFVDTFLALPYLRSRGVEIRSIDDDLYATAACKAWQKRKDLASLRGSLGRMWNGESLIGCACFRYENGAICVCPETDNWPYGPEVKSTKEYRRLKESMGAEGRFRYQDMFAYAQAQLAEAPSIAKTLQERFPVVIIDEMQDTSQLQQMLLSMVFPPEKCIVQRIGDENQRIYDSGSNSPDESFPAKDHMALSYSRRFGANIARVASRLTTKTSQTIAATQDAPVDHTVLVLFDAETVDQVIPAFERYVDENVPADLLSKYGAKAIGARREPKAGESLGGISSYGLAPPRRPSSGTPRSLAEAVGRARRILKIRGNTFGCWQMVFVAVRELLILNGLRIDGRRPSARQLERWLADQGEALSRLRALVRDLVFAQDMTEDKWQQSVSAIRDAMCEANSGGDWSDEAVAFAAFDRDELDANSNSGREGDASQTPMIGVDTIHNVKGETHAATIVLECKKKTTYDLKEVLSLLAGTMPAKRQQQKTIQEILQLAFVAVTRPRVCLGLAVAKDDALPYLESLEGDGWAVLDLTDQVRAISEPGIDVPASKKQAGEP